MTWPESNEKLKELKHKWEEGFFGLDSVGVYSVREAIEEAIDLISMYDFEERDGLLYYAAGNKHPIGVDGVGKTNDYISRELGRQRKTCQVCNRPARNNPCDLCYQMVREAAEWMGEWGTMKVYPCAMCGTEVCSTICRACMDVMLGGE
jgi:hypothetical protein